MRHVQHTSSEGLELEMQEADSAYPRPESQVKQATLVCLYLIIYSWGH